MRIFPALGHLQHGAVHVCRLTDTTTEPRRIPGRLTETRQ